LNQIVDKLKGIPGISFATIATEAQRHKRYELATSLLDYEPRADRQVPLLIKTEKLDRALEKAIQSGDTELIDLVLFRLKKGNLSVNDFYNILLQNPEAYNLWVSMCKETDVRQLDQLYRYERERKLDKLAWICVYQAQHAENLDAQERHMKLALEVFKKCDPFAQRATQEEISLQQLQKELEKDLDYRVTKLVGLSVSETIFKLYSTGGDQFDSKANKIRSDFRVPSNRFAWNKVKALGQGKHWEALKKFSKSEPSIGQKPFAEVCLSHGNKEEALVYIKKISDASEKALLYGRADAWGEALAVVEQMKDPEETLWKLKGACTNPQAMESIRVMLAKANEQ